MNCVQDESWLCVDNLEFGPKKIAFHKDPPVHPPHLLKKNRTNTLYAKKYIG